MRLGSQTKSCNMAFRWSPKPGACANTSRATILQNSTTQLISLHFRPFLIQSRYICLLIYFFDPPGVLFNSKPIRQTINGSMSYFDVSLFERMPSAPTALRPCGESLVFSPHMFTQLDDVVLISDCEGLLAELSNFASLQVVGTTR